MKNKLKTRRARRAQAFAKNSAAIWRIKLTYYNLLYISLKKFLDPASDPDCHPWIFKPPPPVGAGGGYMFSGRPSVPPSVRA